MVHPKNNRTKLCAQLFAKYTKYEARTSEHSRDAAMLVFGRTATKTILNTAGTAGIKACGDMSKDTCAAHEAHESLVRG